jgi:hypothetical protein
VRGTTPIGDTSPMNAPHRPLRPRELALVLTLALWAAGLAGCVLDARLGALDSGESGSDPDSDSGSGSGSGSDTTSESSGDPSVLPPGLEPSADEEVILDCNHGAGYGVSSWRSSEPSSPRLWVGGVYETRSDHSFEHHPVGAGTVEWAVPGQNVLVLGAYEPTSWTLTVAPGGALERVIVTGYHAQTVQAPAGVVVETYSLEADGGDWACGFALPGDGGGCEGEELVAFAERVTGLELYAFDGCYHATMFEYLP